MPVQNKNLKALLKHLRISNIALAIGIDVDSSLVSRWISGARQIKMTSKTMDSLSLFLLSRCRGQSDFQWLNQQFRGDGLAVETESEEERKHNLVLWLASDRAALQRNLSAMPGDTGADVSFSAVDRASYTLTVLYAERYNVVVGNQDIVLCLRQKLERMPDGGEVNLFLSTIKAPCVLNRDFAQTLMKYTTEKRLNVNVVVAVADSSATIAELVNTYVVSIIQARMQISIIYSAESALERRLAVTFNDVSALMVIQTARSTTLPIAIDARDIEIVRDLVETFKSTRRYAYPISQLICDNQPRRVLDVIFSEYTRKGGLDIIKDGLNPLYASSEMFFAFLSTYHQGEELRWRVEEYFKYKKNFDESMCEGGERFREIINRERIESIVGDGYCRMPGVFLMESGTVTLDAGSCVAMLEGYVHYLNTMPNFHLYIAETPPDDDRHCCWHIKHEQHVAIQRWDQPSPVMLYSDHATLIQRVQEYFDEIWSTTNPLTIRENALAILTSAIERLKAKYL